LSFARAEGCSLSGQSLTDNFFRMTAVSFEDKKGGKNEMLSPPAVERSFTSRLLPSRGV